ncbi:MAG: hypothetical protein KY475_13760 [Planctomycetes bacterium]|nr:hypothetical protein [Planctomycetota bacterium]
MPIPVSCRCGKSFAANDNLAGKTVKCPGCQQPLAIPAPGQGAKGAAAQQPAPGAKTPDGKIVAACKCGAKFAAPAELAGKQVKCPKCGQPLTVGGGKQAAVAQPKAAAGPQSPADVIAVTCQCGARFGAKPELRGKTVKCPTCSQPLVVGAAASAVAAGASARSAPAGGGLGLDDLFDEVGLAPRAIGEDACPNCGAALAPEAVLCIQCGFDRQKGKKVKVETIKKVEARKLGPPTATAKGGGQGGGGALKSSIPWEAERGEWGAIFDTVKLVIFEPETAFAGMAPGAVGMSFTFAISAVVVANLVLAPFQLIRAIGGEVDIALLLMVMGFFVVFGIVSSIVGLVFFGLMYHLALKIVGGATQPLSTTLQAAGYLSGSANALAVCPCLLVLGPVVAFYSIPVGMATAHRVSKGKGYLALLIYIVMNIMIYVAIVIAFMTLIGGLAFLSRQ